MLVENQTAVSRCGYGRGEGCCSFLMRTPNGLECAKAYDHLWLEIEELRQMKYMAAKANRCSGPPKFELRKVQ